MSHQGVRLGRVHGGEWDTIVSGTTFTTKPSGTTIEKDYVASTQFTGKIDFGQGTAYKYYRGTAPMTKVLPSGGGTSLSAGTIQVTTGLTTVYDFFCSYRGVTSIAMKRYNYLHASWVRGYKTAGGVTLWISTATAAMATPIAALPTTRGWSGVTIDWLAIGT